MVNSVIKAFNMLEYVALGESGRRLIDIANKFKLKSPTAHNLLKTLIILGFVQKEGDLYCLTKKIFFPRPQKIQDVYYTQVLNRHRSSA